jgi:hypothetical protein
MNQYQQLLDDAVGTPPPSTVDIDAVMSRQRRRGRFLRAGAAGSATAAALTVAVVYAVLPVPADREPTVQEPSAQGPPAKSAPPAPTGEVTRLSRALRQALEKALPAAQFFPNRPPDEEQVDALVFAEDGDAYKATAELRDAAGTGSIYVAIGGESALAYYGKDACDGLGPKPQDVDVMDCKVRTAKDGTLTLLLTTKMKKVTRHVVEILRKNGKAIKVEVDNMSRKDEGAYVARRPQPFLTRNRALTLAQNPAFRLPG